VAIFTLIGIIVAMAFSLSRTPKFVATSEIFLSTPRDRSVGYLSASPYLADEFSQERARSYVHLASRADLARRVVKKLGVDMRPDELAAATSASIVPDTVLIEVAVKSSSSAEAKVLADAVTAELAADIRALESPSGLRVPVVEPVITQAAESPKKPSEPNIPIYYLFGASGGFLVGVTTASWLGRRRVEGTQVEQFTGRPVLGTVVSASADSEGFADGGSSKSELVTRQWDQIRRSVDFEIEHPCDRVLAVTAGNGSGRSSASAAGLASAFVRAGSRVVLVVAQPDAHRNVGTRECPVAGLAEVIAGESRLDDAIQAADDENLYRIIGPQPDNLAPLLQSEKFRGVVGELRDFFDLVIFDSPWFLQEAESAWLSGVVDAVILVMPERNIDKRDLSSAVRLINNSQVRLLGSILNSDSPRLSHSGPKHTLSSH
jgi:Mrp family chromosome partitioning ATPase